VAPTHGDHARPPRQPAGRADLRRRLGVGPQEAPHASGADHQHDRPGDGAVDGEQDARHRLVHEPSLAQTAQQIVRPEHPRQEEQRVQQEQDAAHGEQDPALDPDAGVQPFELPARHAAAFRHACHQSRVMSR